MHLHVDVHELGAGDGVARCCGEGLAFVQVVALDVEFACCAIGNKIRAGSADQQSSYDSFSNLEFDAE